MEVCSSVEMRKNLEVADQLCKVGIDFVCVPVSSNACKDTLITQGNEALEALIKDAENE